MGDAPMASFGLLAKAEENESDLSNQEDFQERGEERALTSREDFQGGSCRERFMASSGPLAK
jgi:hypothetical protein